MFTTVYVVGSGTSRGPAIDTSQVTICRTDLLVAISLQYQEQTGAQLSVKFLKCVSKDGWLATYVV